MEGVEDIPGVVLTEGLKWDWETFPQFLDALDAIPHDIDFATQVPHGALRVYVMGERGANRDPATDEDIAAMAHLAKEAVEAGALGFSTSRTLNHRTAEGAPTPTLTAEADELVGIAMGLKQAGQGVLQIVSDLKDPKQEFAMFFRMMKESGRPLSLSVAQAEAAPEAWRRILHEIGVANDQGLAMRAQVCGRPVGILLGLELTLNPFSGRPSYEEIAHLPLEERVKAMRSPEFRSRLLSEEQGHDHPFMQAVLDNYHKIFPLGDPPDYEPAPEASLGAIAERQGVSPFEVALDLVLENNGRGLLYFPFLNYADFNLDSALAMIKDPHTLLGLGDGGAHVGTICDGSFPTTMLTHWTRDRTRGEKLSIPFVIKSHTHDTARAVSLNDRGTLEPGMKADINIIDYDGLTLHAPEVRYDLPAGGRRLIQRADGYVASLVSGEVIYRDGEPTGALPGKLIRGPQG